MISALGAAIQKTAASSEQRPAVQGMAKKKLTAVEAPSSEIITLEPFCISVIALLRQYVKNSYKVPCLPRYKGTAELKTEVMNKDGADSKILNKNHPQY